MQWVTVICSTIYPTPITRPDRNRMGQSVSWWAYTQDQCPAGRAGRHRMCGKGCLSNRLAISNIKKKKTKSREKPRESKNNSTGLLVFQWKLSLVGTGIHNCKVCKLSVVDHPASSYFFLFFLNRKKPRVLNCKQTPDKNTKCNINLLQKKNYTH